MRIRLDLQCIELEKLPRVSKTDLKGKGKQREPVYDCNEASLHDAILRTRLLLGYETFKVMICQFFHE